MKRPLAIDLCCKAGGVSMGLHSAGFDVVGVDIEPQPRYPFKFIQADALTLDLSGYDFIWASPHCQGYTSLRHAPGAKGKPQQIAQFRARMPADVLWAIENVEAAAWDMNAPVTLCGSMFGLSAQGCQLQRHRLIEANFQIDAPQCSHGEAPVIGVYGGHARRRAASAGGRSTRDVWDGGHKTAASDAMGIDWMTLSELSEAIPPAYAEFVGRAAIKTICDRRRLLAARLADSMESKDRKAVLIYVNDAGEMESASSLVVDALRHFAGASTVPATEHGET